MLAGWWTSIASSPASRITSHRRARRARYSASGKAGSLAMPGIGETRFIGRSAERRRARRSRRRPALGGLLEALGHLVLDGQRLQEAVRLGLGDEGVDGFLQLRRVLAHEHPEIGLVDDGAGQDLDAGLLLDQLVGEEHVGDVRV